ncbi:hypothetical protein Ddye_027002 [Dipteronia dyeriana]|nr:hypothetical protein Ddye_027002 [Dipteronia dyeriana]
MLPITYLGLSLGSRPSSEGVWVSVVSNIEKRLSPWKRKFLSKGGHLVLIKSVLNSIPTYFMSVFRMPIGVVNKIERLQRSFLWGDGIEKRKIHAVDWASVCNNNTSGGLGIGRMVDKNVSLLAKWVWRFGFDRNSLCKKVLCAKYGIQVKILSWDWKSNVSSSYFIKAVANVISTGNNFG